MTHERRFKGDVSRLRSPERVARLEVERVVELCLEGAGEDDPIRSVLDVGTGSGLFAEAFAGRGLEVGGVDANPEMIPVARQFVPQGDFREAPAERLPFPGRNFDLVFLGLVLHETDDPLKALQEARRVARRRVCLIEWPYEQTEFGPPLEDRLDAEKIEAMAHQAGLTPVFQTRLSGVVFYRLE